MFSYKKINENKLKCIILNLLIIEKYEVIEKCEMIYKNSFKD